MDVLIVRRVNQLRRQLAHEDNSEWYCARPEVFDFEQMLKLSFVFSEGKHLFIASQPALNEDLLLKFRDNL